MYKHEVWYKDFFMPFEEWLNEQHREGWMLVSHSITFNGNMDCVFINMRSSDGNTHRARNLTTYWPSSLC